MNDWKARAEREAAAILAQAASPALDVTYAYAVELVALGWLQGAIFASHLDLQALEMGVDDLKAAL